MSLLEQIALADERGLAASGLACLDRCLPPTGRGDPEPLRPLWASCENGADWVARLAGVREALECDAPEGEASGDTGPEGGGDTGSVAARVRALLAAAPADFEAEPLRAWSDACSLLALDVHREFDLPSAGGAELLRRCRAGGTEGVGPLVSGELRRQIEILDVLAETAGTVGSGAGLLRVLDLSTEGQRVLRAVMSRRARSRA
ncbi:MULTISPECIES: hypothetical protein [Streptomyces]|uniref:hypothetical protein n=1 Tax=Streptomyces TaxID=1883 RepID=UPI000701FF68|nr:MULTISPECIES: hypothetical protein [unclassified Streptomyces]KQX81445.1 hypothetical protein ASD26_07210 [Streptomyces sp. Root1319]KQZ04168.1 hypothetical protein ASD51_15020 [Streptomyces sp. Root55]WRY83815.1 hypothetical protein OG388_22570 [Streptomyces clavifer]